MESLMLKNAKPLDDNESAPTQPISMNTAAPIILMQEGSDGMLPHSMLAFRSSTTEVSVDSSSECTCACPFAIGGQCENYVSDGARSNLCTEIVRDGSACNCPCEACTGDDSNLSSVQKLAAAESAGLLMQLREEALDSESTVMGSPTNDRERNDSILCALRSHWSHAITRYEDIEPDVLIIQAACRRWLNNHMPPPSPPPSPGDPHDAARETQHEFDQRRVI